MDGSSQVPSKEVQKKTSSDSSDSNGGGARETGNKQVPSPKTQAQSGEAEIKQVGYRASEERKQTNKQSVKGNQVQQKKTKGNGEHVLQKKSKVVSLKKKVGDEVDESSNDSTAEGEIWEIGVW